MEARLGTRGVTLDIQIVGGAALLLHGILDRATSDIDARYTPIGDVVKWPQPWSRSTGCPRSG
nr:DUF6036 family nucleotidyltransferase [Arthrobacter sp. Rue61a]